MANMSYCRFQNTLKDLFDASCHMDLSVDPDYDSTLVDSDEISEETRDAMLSADETQARKDLIELCCTIAGAHGDMADYKEAWADGFNTARANRSAV